MSTATKNGLLALDAASATITTASVTIRTLRVGTKQLTQAVFRQLPSRNLVDSEKVELKGTVWGWVNFTPADEKPKAEYDDVPTQFVAQFGEELCRCPFVVRHQSQHSSGVIGELRRRYDVCARAVAYARVLAGDESIFVKVAPYVTPPITIRHASYFGDSVFETYDGYEPRDWPKFREHIQLFERFLRPRDTGKYFPDKGGGSTYRNVSAADDKEVARLAILDAAKAITPLDEQALLCRMTEHADRAKAYAERWNALMDRLGTAPQLFIAV
jgi:hypothetical protein